MMNATRLWSKLNHQIYIKQGKLIGSPCLFFLVIVSQREARNLKSVLSKQMAKLANGACGW
ncbi:hypothetical protein D1115_18405 [Vibrio alfacsensis]|uniref:Uncharacterized protein n=1 Tax=Vibrio alfacsensis TaxID=1074311 RepID=A0ABN5PKZ7_9VIBR|nr:hypothetical protein D1115_18405 [Vibrio alfacsensis]